MSGQEGRVAKAPERVRFESAPSVLEALASDLGLAPHHTATGSGAAPARLVVDLGAAADFDSSLVAVILELQRRALRDGADLALVGVGASLRQLVSLYGAQSILGDAA